MNRNARILKEEGDKENKIGNIAPWMDGWPSERKEHYCIALLEVTRHFMAMMYGSLNHTIRVFPLLIFSLCLQVL